MNTKTFIEKVASGEANEAKDILNDILSSRAFDSIDARKIEIAQSLYSNEEVEVQDTADTPMEDELLTQEEFDALSEEEQEMYLEQLEQLEEIDEATDYALVHSSSGREVDRGSKEDMIKKVRTKEQGSHHVAAIQKPTTSSKLSRLARKIIPGQGQKQAGERARGQEYSAGLDRAALKYHPDDKKLATTMKSSEKAQQRYKRISRGESPFKPSPND
jgi:hypothetical protein